MRRLIDHGSAKKSVEGVNAGSASHGAEHGLTAVPVPSVTNLAELPRTGEVVTKV